MGPPLPGTPAAANGPLSGRTAPNGAADCVVDRAAAHEAALRATGGGGLPGPAEVLADPDPNLNPDQGPLVGHVFGVTVEAASGLPASDDGAVARFIRYLFPGMRRGS